MTRATLMLTPVLPSPTGGGSLMRAAATLECLASRGPVVVVHAECWGPTPEVADLSWCRGRAAAVVVIQPSRLADLPSILPDVLETAGLDRSLDAIHVFRQVLAAIGLECGRRFQPRRTLLDLDDDEGDLDAFLIGLRRTQGEAAMADALEAGRRRRAAIRAMLLPRFDRVFLANPLDVVSMRADVPRTSFAFLPNVVAAVEPSVGIARDPDTMLFLGTLGYLPNEDGVGWFIDEILPRIRAAAGRMRLRVAGAGRPERLERAFAAEGVEYVGAVAEVGPEYAAAGQLVVPLRAGSGTRIKILEAFRHGAPVVSTAIGAAGLGIVDGEQALLADSPDAFAAACLRLAVDGAASAGMAARAAEWVARHHSLASMRAVLHDALDGGGTAP